MVPIYPSTALKNQQREIKKLACQQPVHITENGRGKYVFMSEDVFEHAISEAVETALYEQRLSSALDESRQDFKAGRYYTSREDLLQAVTAKRAGRSSNAQA